ncbi:MAG: hypothetical protein PHW73_06080 [Atribacterota bacterium]|nr:hypothetical protein [Atribacterota bacterium]
MKDFFDSIEDSTIAETAVFKLKFSDYKPVLFSNSLNSKKKEWYIKGIVPVEENRIVNYEKYDILLTLINLYQGIDKSNGKEIDSVICEEVITWCKKYGIPFVSKYFNEKYYEDKNENPLNIDNYVSTSGEKPQVGYTGFCLNEFIRRIHVLHDYFQLWYGLTFDELERTAKYSNTVGLKIDSIQSISDQIIQIKGSLALFISSKMSTHIRLVYDVKHDSYSFIPANNDFISVAYYQLAMLSVSKGIKSIKICSVCHKAFEVEHAGKKICKTCNREYHRLKMQESRRNKSLSIKERKSEQ